MITRSWVVPVSRSDWPRVSAPGAYSTLVMIVTNAHFAPVIGVSVINLSEVKEGVIHAEIHNPVKSEMKVKYRMESMKSLAQ